MTPPEYKRCSRCGEDKPLEDFNRDRSREDGRQRYCRACARAWAEENRDRRSKLARRWYIENRERKLEMAKRWERENRERRAELSRRSREKHPDKVRARTALMHAVQGGKVVKPERCENCGKHAAGRGLHGHHKDYSRPLDVEWLCVECHAAAHFGPLVPDEASA